MRRYHFLFASILCFCACKKETTEVQPPDGSTTTKGTDLQPLTNAVHHGVYHYVTKEFDSAGVLERMESATSSNGSFSIGIAQPRFGRFVNAIQSLDSNGVSDIGFVSMSGDSIYSNERGSGKQGLMLPANLKIGTTWNPAPLTVETQCEAKVAEILPTFRNFAGKLFSDVYRVAVSFNHQQSENVGVTHFIGEANFYFAKGKGIVGLAITKYQGFDDQNREIGEFALEGGVSD